MNKHDLATSLTLGIQAAAIAHYGGAIAARATLARAVARASETEPHEVTDDMILAHFGIQFASADFEGGVLNALVKNIGEETARKIASGHAKITINTEPFVSPARVVSIPEIRASDTGSFFQGSSRLVVGSNFHERILAVVAFPTGRVASTNWGIYEALRYDANGEGIRLELPLGHAAPDPGEFCVRFQHCIENEGEYLLRDGATCFFVRGIHGYVYTVLTYVQNGVRRIDTHPGACVDKGSRIFSDCSPN